MADEATDRLRLPLLSAGQAQKEIAHNEALTLLDILVQGNVASRGLATPPVDPDPGAGWIVAAGATGAWAGQADAIAAWTAGGWRFVAPSAGMTMWVEDDAGFATFDGGGWLASGVAADGIHVAAQRVVGARQAAVAAPSGGGTVDAEARSAIAAIIARLQAHGLIA